ncbi:PREDICTED: protein grindelwald-like [Diuraphis noxia]|uniref:protein grindelwald-like n=1 Tax=Diuraphis noxia TaxID=143948 RepID=UPI000763B571|nr:PREDICTED: protein grindelwald-like [Diuraphis noxia]
MAGLSLRKPCGEKECPEYHMCQPHDLQCYPCHSYCNETSHNFDVKICQQQCQDYIHDYVKHYVKDSNIQDVLQELETLKSLIIWLTLLVIVAVVLMSVMLAFVWKRERKIPKLKNGGKDSYFKKKLAFLKFRNNTVNTVSETPWTVAAATNMMAAQTTDASKTSSASSSSVNRTSRTTVSSTSTSSTDKLPCEDATLVTQEFTGYDNLGLCKVSPVLSKPTATMKMYGATDVDLLHRYSP